MGAKSFDHSKKFWFNKLRRLYHIVEEPKAEKTKIEINQIASQAEPLSSPVPESKTGFTSRFEAKSDFSEEDTASAEIPSIKESEIESNAKPTFKPRFKPQLTKLEIKEEGKSESAESGENLPKSLEVAVPKLGFKPRFKPQITKQVPVIGPDKVEEERDVEASEEAKPIGFKPRFKPQMAKPRIEATEESEVRPTELKEEFKTEASAPKLGFKPRFNAGITTPRTEIPETKEASSSSENITDEKPANQLGFKPRFRAGVTKAPTAETEFAETNENSIGIEPIEIAVNSDNESHLQDSIETEEKTNNLPSLNSSNTSNEEKLAATPTPKLGFKPRFKAQATKQNPPENPE